MGSDKRKRQKHVEQERQDAKRLQPKQPAEMKQTKDQDRKK